MDRSVSPMGYVLGFAVVVFLLYQVGPFLFDAMVKKDTATLKSAFPGAQRDVEYRDSQAKALWEQQHSIPDGAHQGHAPW